MKDKSATKDRGVFAKLLAKVRPDLDKLRDELDKAGVERKALSPEVVEEVRDGLVEIVPDIDEEATTAIMQMIVEVLSEEMPDSDVDEENAAMDDEDDDKAEGDDDEEEKEIAKLTEQVTDLAKGFNDLVKDMSEVVKLNIKSAQNMTADKKEFTGLVSRLGAIEKQLNKKPRRASQAPETQLDPESELSKSLANRDFTPPPAFADLFDNGGVK